MCGIVGVASFNAAHVNAGRLKAMTDSLAHRGPDGAGYWLNPEQSVGLGHRRLSIIDLSEAGVQPMTSLSGRYTITFNGEIYNFAALRQQLEAQGAKFRGSSDTEVLVNAFDHWGIEQTLQNIDGMFAFAVWDSKTRTLTLARDRIGIKPLYYSVEGEALIFASELRPLVKWKQCIPDICPAALSEYLRLGYVPGPMSIFSGVHKLMPGHQLTWSEGRLMPARKYWDLTSKFQEGKHHSIADANEARAALKRTLDYAVTSHMVSDVPLGAFLSGGVDSSTVVALMQAHSTRPIKTFSIGFGEDRYNEAPYAAAVAKHLGTDHHELYISDADARAVIPMLPDIYDEPFADASQIPTYLVSKLARQHVTVSLSGDGGDELFGGYNRYVFVSNFWNKLQRIPPGLRIGAAKLLAYPSVARWDQWFRYLKPVLPERFSPALPGEKMHKVARTLSSRTLFELHGRLVAQWLVPENALSLAYKTKPDYWDGVLDADNGLSPPEQQMLWDAKTYLVDDILTKVDRASMSVGLEARVPLLDHHVVELACRIPLSMKIREGQSKWLLREVLYEHVPKELIERPKMGFGVPLDDWLRGPLRGWAETYLSTARLEQEGYFDPLVIRSTWEAHLRGSLNCAGMLWTILMFQLWHERVKQWV